MLSSVHLEFLKSAKNCLLYKLKINSIHDHIRVNINIICIRILVMNVALLFCTVLQYGTLVFCN